MNPTDERQKLYNGFGETFSRAVEFVVTPMLFGWFGHVIDGRLDAGVVFTVALGAFALIGMFLRTWYAYVNAMQEQERGAPWSRT